MWNKGKKVYENGMTLAEMRAAKGYSHGYISVRIAAFGIAGYDSLEPKDPTKQRAPRKTAPKKPPPVEPPPPEIDWVCRCPRCGRQHMVNMHWSGRASIPPINCKPKCPSAK